MFIQFYREDFNFPEFHNLLITDWTQTKKKSVETYFQTGHFIELRSQY